MQKQNKKNKKMCFWKSFTSYLNNRSRLLKPATHLMRLSYSGGKDQINKPKNSNSQESGCWKSDVGSLEIID